MPDRGNDSVTSRAFNTGYYTWAHERCKTPSDLGQRRKTSKLFPNSPGSVEKWPCGLYYSHIHSEPSDIVIWQVSTLFQSKMCPFKERFWKSNSSYAIGPFSKWLGALERKKQTRFGKTGPELFQPLLGCHRGRKPTLAVKNSQCLGRDFGNRTPLSVCVQTYWEVCFWKVRTFSGSVKQKWSVFDKYWRRYSL